MKLFTRESVPQDVPVVITLEDENDGVEVVATLPGGAINYLGHFTHEGEFHRYSLNGDFKRHFKTDCDEKIEVK